MNAAQVPVRPQDRPGFTDGLGTRSTITDSATGETLELLTIRPELTRVASFEFALRERSARLANFRHEDFARVRRIDRTTDGGLGIVSDYIPGARLSDVLNVSSQRRLPFDVGAAFCLVRQLVPAIAFLHDNARDVAHGAIALERLVVTPLGRLMVVEHVLGSALEQLRFSREHLWREVRVAMPPSAGAPRFDHHADVTQIGIVVLQLVLGRPLRSDEYPARLASLVDQAAMTTAGGERRPLTLGLHSWLVRALHIDLRRAFASAREACQALEQMLAAEPGYVAAPVSLETFLTRVMEATSDGAAPAGSVPPATVDPAPAPPPPMAAQPAAPAYAEPPAPIVMDPVPPPAPPPPAPPPPPQASAPNVTASYLDPLVSVSSAPPQAPPPVPPAPVSQVDAIIPVPLVEAVRPQQHPQPPPVELSSIDARPFEPDLRQMLQLGTDPTPARGTPRVEVTPARGLPRVEVPSSVTTTPSVPLKRTDLPVEPIGAGMSSTTDSPFGRPSTEPITVKSEPRRYTAPEPRHAPEPPPYVADEPRRRGVGGKRRLIAAVIACVAVVGVAGVYASRWLFTGASETEVQLGIVLVESNPAGVQVFVDGEARGLTPAKVSLKPGAHLVELRGRGTPRVRSVMVEAGATVSHYVELAEASAPVTGQLDVRSDPPGARVKVDGHDAGIAPILVSNLQPGEHTVVLQNDHGTVRHTVTIEPGLTAALVTPMAAGPQSGWISITAPFAMQVYESGDLIGSTETDKILVTAGTHHLQIINDTLGFKISRNVNVPAGKVVPIGIELPNGVVNINAVPWAEVFVDGRAVGETPIGNLQLPIGPHEVVFRNPQFGERRQAISVTLGGPIRVSVDMNKQ
jgi:serine/threonine protein kinase